MAALVTAGFASDENQPSVDLHTSVPPRVETSAGGEEITKALPKFRKSVNHNFHYALLDPRVLKSSRYVDNKNTADITDDEFKAEHVATLDNLLDSGARINGFIMSGRNDRAESDGEASDNTERGMQHHIWVAARHAVDGVSYAPLNYLLAKEAEEVAWWKNVLYGEAMPPIAVFGYNWWYHSDWHTLNWLEEEAEKAMETFHNPEKDASERDQAGARAQNIQRVMAKVESLNFRRNVWEEEIEKSEVVPAEEVEETSTEEAPEENVEVDDAA